jgi:hypothetical protein
MQQRAQKKTVLVLSRITLPITVVLTVGMPIIAAVIAYTEARGDTKREFIQIRLESEQTFVQKKDFHELQSTLDAINMRLSHIEGYLRKDSRGR